jgi:hypothetical protein
MKAKDANKSFPSWKKLVLYVAGVAAFCILNCLTMQARDYNALISQKGILNKPFIYEEPTPIFTGTANWVVNFQQQFVSLIIRQRVARYYNQSVTGGDAAGMNPAEPAVKLRDLKTSKNGGVKCTNQR